MLFTGARPFRPLGSLLPRIVGLGPPPSLPHLPALTALLPLPALPSKMAGLSVALLKATALEVAILAGHLLLYPSGIAQERRVTPVLPPPGAPRLPSDDRPPVLLLHGFIDNRSVFVLLRRALSQQGGRRVESLNYSPLTCDVRGAAELLGRHIEELCERTGHARVDVVGHSLGGLIARYYAQRQGGDARIRTLVTLGTPHAGTRVVPLANAHPIVRQMRPGSDVIEELKEPAPDCRTQFVSFWSDLDQIMDPLETACVDHPDLTAQNVRVTGIGHLALPVHPAVANGIRQALDLANPGTDAQSAPGGLTVA
ncbi:alpha/beta fold hydrolase [Streptomyces sp. SID335]|nr:alpha/beta fold hydrolase [Streptomyces sp. SID335]MYZ13088.1 alpha/beta fold hydrolase [Streptomyces sp. SID337]NDZ91868.1 alpha/beta fold hydrolase [Streptomyces sp. SID10115]NEA02715.1 alpha/beta fold hydrolase [Streptomyces sp. SID10116]NEB46491.1 alpha/beta fold hydrolase [Streptomyces sp. SID339]